MESGRSPSQPQFFVFEWSQSRWLPDRFDSGGLETAVPSDKWKAKVEGSRGDDTVRHVGNYVARNILKGICNQAVDRGDEQSDTRLN